MREQWSGASSGIVSIPARRARFVLMQRAVPPLGHPVRTPSQLRRLDSGVGASRRADLQFRSSAAIRVSGLASCGACQEDRMRLRRASTDVAASRRICTGVIACDERLRNRRAMTAATSSTDERACRAIRAFHGVIYPNREVHCARSVEGVRMMTAPLSLRHLTDAQAAQWGVEGKRFNPESVRASL
jgi:hypothetical protein